MLELNIVSSNEKERRALEKLVGELGWLVDSFSNMPELIDLLGEMSEKQLMIYSVPAKQEVFEKEKEILISYLKKNSRQQLILIVPKSLEGADRLAIELGARHILFRPFSSDDIEELLSKVAAGIGKRRLRRRSAESDAGRDPFSEIIGTSEKIKEVIELARKVAESECTSIMITGECGTGKGTLAKAIHQASERRDGPFVEVNCAAIPRNLLESEFFGYEKGAFTDAREEKPGLFEVADGGTIFLDEISEIDYALQAKLLKFLDTRMVRRVSGVRFLPVDVRIISATNRELKAEVAAKRFREDLYYRLNVVEIYLPPLRERPEDIEPIARAYLERFSSRLSKGEIALSEDAMKALREYHWPGNVRELINVVERAVLLNRSGIITAADLPIEGTPAATMKIRKSQGTIRIEIPEDGVALDEVECGLIVAALEKAGGNIMEAARLLKLGRGALRYKMKKYGITTENFKKIGQRGLNEPVGVTD